MVFIMILRCDHHFSTEDLETIEKKMQELAKADLTIERAKL